jgi:hypothetical protein
MAVTGCGGGGSDALVSSNTQTLATTPQVAGVYRMVLPEGQTLEIVLSQTGSTLSGDGAIFEGDDPLPVRVHGAVESDGSSVLILNSTDHTGVTNQTRLDLLLGPEESLADVTDIDQRLILPQATLRRVVQPANSLPLPLSLSLSLPVGSDSVPLQVTLDSPSALAGANGTWAIAAAGTPLQVASRIFRQGRVELYQSTQSDWARLRLLDPDSALPLGTIWFRRDTPTSIDPDSLVLVEPRPSFAVGAPQGD